MQQQSSSGSETVKPADFSALAEKITQALIGNNFELYRSIIRLPLRVVPRDGEPYVLETVADLESNFDMYCAVIKTNNITDIFRHPISITQVDEDWVEVTVETHLMSKAERIIDPFCNQFVLRPHQGEWKISTIRSSLAQLNWALGKSKVGKPSINRTTPASAFQRQQSRDSGPEKPVSGIIRKGSVSSHSASNYPAPFDALGSFSTMALSDAGGLTQFGVHHETLMPDAISSQRHWHEQEDEFLYVLTGTLTLIDEAGRHQLHPGDAVTWKAGIANAHHVSNTSQAPVTYLIMGTRSKSEISHYPDIDLKYVRTDGQGTFCHKDATPYPSKKD